jgi:hypothetical protein
MQANLQSMSEKDLQELKEAIADRSIFENAGLRTLLRYDRTVTTASGNDIPPALRDELRGRITKKITILAVTVVIIASMTAGMIALLQRVFAT